jgi:hypothetical protein
VENEGRNRAEKVQVSAMKLARRNADGKGFTEVPTTLPFNMRWSNYPPNAPVAVLDGISRKMWAFCDIMSLCDPGNPYERRPTGANPAETVGKIELEFDLPDDEWQLLAPDTYQLTLRIGGANSAPVDQIIEFTHGKWSDDDGIMRRSYLAVSLK